MVLRLIDRGFRLVADDRVDIEDGWASAPAALAGLLEVRGLGIVRIATLSRALLALAVDLAGGADRLPHPARHPSLNVPLVAIDPSSCSAPLRIALALDCALGRTAQIAGTFA
jgi:HPr kinase/phosphorylase